MIDSIGERISIQPGPFGPRRLYVSAACPALSGQGGFMYQKPARPSRARAVICISGLPGSFESGRLYLQSDQLFRARAPISAACPALSSQGGYACIRSLPGPLGQGQLYLYQQPARLSRARAATCNSSLPGSLGPGQLYVSAACPALSDQGG